MRSNSFIKAFLTLVTGIFVLLGRTSRAQINVDSLTRAAYTKTHTIPDIIDIARSHHDSDPAAVKRLCLNLLPLLHTKRDTLALAIVYGELGNVYRILQPLDNAIQAFKLAAFYSRVSGDSAAFATCLLNIGQMHVSRYELEKAVPYYQHAERLFRYERNDTSRLYYQISTDNSYAELYTVAWGYDAALSRYNKAIDAALQLKDDELLAGLYASVGNLFTSNLGRHDSAILWYTKALQHFESRDNELGVGLSRFNLAECHFKKNDLDNAVTENRIALKLLKPTGAYYGYPVLLQAKIAYRGNELDKALSLYTEAAPLLDGLGVKPSVGESYQGVGKVYHEKGNYQRAREYYHAALHIFQGVKLIAQYNTQSIGTRDILLALAELSADEGENDSVTYYYRKFHDATQTLVESITTVSARNASLIVEAPIKAQQIRLQQAELEVRQGRITLEQERSLRLAVTLGLAGALLLALGYFTIRLRRKNRIIAIANLELEEKNELITVLNRGIIHANKGYIDILLELLWEKQGAAARGSSIYKILDAVYTAPDLTSVHYSTFLPDLCREIAQALDVQIKVDIDDALVINAELAIILSSIIEELLRNAATHGFADKRQANLFVSVHKVDAETIALRVSDNGIGLPENVSPDNAERGLRVVKNLADKKYGIIDIARDSGTHYFITLKL